MSNDFELNHNHERQPFADPRAIVHNVTRLLVEDDLLTEEGDEPIWIRHYLGGEIDSDTAAATIAALYDVDSQYPDATLEFVINSRGGELIHGNAIYSELAALSLQGGGDHRVVTKIRGEAGSVASLIFQAGDWRVGGKLDIITLHQPHQTLEDANITVLREKVAEMGVWVDLYTDVHMERATMTRKAFLDRLDTGKDWILTLEEAIDLGLADEIG